MLSETEKYNKFDKVKEFLLINLGLFMAAIGIHAFKNPNRFALGGVSGISLVLNHYFPQVPIGTLMMVLNVFLLVIAFLLLDNKMALKSLYGSVVISGLVMLMEHYFPISKPLTDQKFLELIFGIFLPGIGGALVFNYDATTGGTDIIAKIISKYSKIKVSYVLLIVDFLIALYAGILFGVETSLFSVLGVILKIFILDSLLENLQVNKIIVVISEESQKIKRYICYDLDRGATVHSARGAFTVNEKEVITTVLNRREAGMLQRFIRKTDPKAFITISNSSRIIGKGFTSI